MALEDLYTKLTIEDEERGIELQEDDVPQENDEYRYCLVGRFLKVRAIYFISMRSTMASIWRPKKGICIKDLGAGIYVFQFFHTIDMNRVLDNGPWTFNNHLLLLKHLKEDENPMKVDIFETSLWVQVHEVPAGFRSERVLVHVGNYIGNFLSSDPKNFSEGWKTYLRIRVLMDIRLPLKRRMKLKKPGGEWVWMNFKYEQVPTFCFICGKIGHPDSNCGKLYEAEGEEIERLYGTSLRAPLRNNLGLVGERWLRTPAMEVPNSNLGKEVSQDNEEENSMQVGDNHASVTKGKGVIQGPGSINSFHIPPPPPMLSMKENPLYKEGIVEDPQLEESCENMGITILDQKRRWMESYSEVNLNNSTIELEPMHDDPKNGWQGPPIKMSVLSWNCRGLGNPRAVQVLVDLVNLNKPDFIFLIETLACNQKMSFIKNKLNYDCCIVVECIGHSGGLALLWKEHNMASLISLSRFHIDVEVSMLGQSKWRLTRYYGNPDRNKRRESWDQLRLLATSSTLPWVCLGDISDLLFQHEKMGEHEHPNWLLNGFKETIEDCHLCDLGMEGYQFTWFKTGVQMDGSKNDWTGLLRPQIGLIFSNMLGYNLGQFSSYHAPIFLQPKVPLLQHSHRKFRFENMWLHEKDCKEVISSSWNKTEGEPILRRIKYCGDDLLRWGGSGLRQLNFKIKQSRSTIHRLHRRIDPEGIEELRKAQAKYFQALHQKEIYWKQRSRKIWLRDGDSNTKYFHKAASSLKRMNRIERLKDKDGN